jgi:hypothetical protein
MNRRSFLTLAPAAALTIHRFAVAPAGAQEATPAPTERYVSEQFGYQVAWPSDWTFVESDFVTSDSGSDGYDMVHLARENQTAYIVLSRPGDTTLAEIVQFMIDGPDREVTFVPGMTANDQDGNPIEGESSDRAWLAQLGNLAGEIVDGFTQFRYGEVRLLEPNFGAALSLAMPAVDFDGDIAPYSALLDSVTKVVVATPVSGS